MGAYEDPSLIPYRLTQLEGWRRQSEDWRRTVDDERVEQRGEVATMGKQIVVLSDAVDNLRRTLVGFAITIAVSALVFALSILAATGRI